MNEYFPILEGFVKNVLTNYNSQTAELLTKILDIFYTCMHATVNNYMRDFNVLGNWILYLNTVMKAPWEVCPENQSIVIKIFLKFLKVYASDNGDGKNYKGWAS